MPNLNLPFGNMTAMLSGTDKQLNSQLSRRKKFIDIIQNTKFTDRETIEWLINVINTTNELEYDSLCNILGQNIKIENKDDAIIACQLLELMIEEPDKVTREQFYSLFSVLKMIDDSLYEIYDKDPQKNIDDYFGAIAVIKRVGNKLTTINNYFKFGYVFENDGTFVPKIEQRVIPNDMVVHESTFFGTDPNVDGSTLEYNTDGDLDILIKYLRDLQYSECTDVDSDFLIAHFKDLPDLINKIYTSGSKDPAYLGLPYYMITVCHNSIRNNLYGLETLDDTLDNVMDTLDDIAYSTFEAREASAKLAELIEIIEHDIAKEEYLIRLGDVPDDVNPIVECGLGFIYEYIPIDDPEDESRSDALIEAMSTKEALMAMNVLMESINTMYDDETLTEGIAKEEFKLFKARAKDPIDRHFTKGYANIDYRKANVQRKIDNRERNAQYSADAKASRHQAIEDNKTRNLQTRLDTNTGINQAKKDARAKDAQRKLDYKTAKKDDKYERKLQKYQARQDIKDVKAQLRKIHTSGQSYGKMSRLLKLLSAGSLIHNRPMRALVFAFFAKLLGDKRTDAQTRARAYNEVNQQIAVIDQKLQSTNNPTTANELSLMKAKLLQIKTAAAAGMSNAGGGGVVGIPEDSNY